MTVKEQYQKMFKLAQAYNDTQECYDEALFQAFLYNLVTNKPKKLNISGIFTDTYNFYSKYINLWGDIQWKQCIDESHEIEHKYNNDMCTEMIVQILDLIEKKFKEGAKR